VNIKFSKNLLSYSDSSCYFHKVSYKIPFEQQTLKLVALPDSGFACPPLAVVSIHQSYWWY